MLLPLIRTCLALLTCWILQSNIAYADIIMHVDSAANQLWFTGSATGTPGDNSGIKEISWLVENNWNPGTVFSDFFDPDFSFVGNLPAFEGYFTHTHGSGHNNIALTIRFDTFDATTIQAGGTKYNYGGFHPENVNFIESLVGSSLSTNFGNGFSSIQVMGITAVPEPNSIILVSVAACCWSIRRKREAYKA